jgi:signal transduction histidine kinase
MMDTPTRPELEHLEAELRLTLEEVARLQNALAEANIRIHNLQNLYQVGNDSHEQEREIIASIVQEVRQPMTSMIGYTDLLSGESTGVLNAFQHKFINRIKAASERMQVLLDDLIQITDIQTGHFEIHPMNMDPNEVVDQSLLAVRGQLREKNILLKLDVSKRMPIINADRNGIQQILTRLLHNACLASPLEGEMVLRVMVEKNATNLKEQSFLRLQVTDSGGGVTPENIPNVFLPRFKPGSPLLLGVGETGVGLYLAKLLVEAHHGNIWVESDQGKTTTINALIPS